MTDRAGASAPALRRVHTADLAPGERTAIRALLLDAFDGDFDDHDWDHALGGLHVLVHDAAELVGHASVVQRQVAVQGVPHRVGYVEAVAVSPHRRRAGVGATVMAAVEDVVCAAYDFGVLSASTAGLRLYLGRGWAPWRGHLSTHTAGGVVATPDDAGSVLVWGPPIADGSVDLGHDLTADPRRGAPW